MAIPFIVAAAALLAAAGAQNNYENDRVQDRRNDNVLKYAKNLYPDLSDRELKGILQNYRVEDNDLDNLWGLFGDNYTYDYDSIKQDLEKLQHFSDGMPTAPDLDAIRAETDALIDKENNEILGMYDADKQRQTDLYNQQLSDSNAAYNRNIGQILSNDYQKNAQLMGTLRSEMNRSQRNALESGASAGLRIAGNINTALSLQNKQSQQSLETSNNLAQMLLNQQQANAGLRSEYGNYLSQDTANRASLKSGTVERKDAEFNTAVSNANMKYDQDMRNWENAYYSKVGATNPFAESYRSKLYTSQYDK